MISLWTWPIALSWVYTIFGVIYAISIISTILVILSENRSPVKSLAWVTVLLLLPMVGIILYIFFGRSIKNTRMISRRNSRRLRKKEPFKRVKNSELDVTEESKQQMRLAHNLTRAIYFPGNEVEIYTSGKEKFQNLLNDILAAKKYINIQYYIIDDDNIGTTVANALMKKAKEGLSVRVIYDHVGSFKTKNKFFKAMRDAGVQALPFFRVAFPSLGTRINWRNHRKIAVIDGTVGYIGGMNIADRYIDGGDKFDVWRDTHLRICGPAVAALQYSFAVDWNFMGQPLIEDDVDLTPRPGAKAVMQMLTSGPTSQWSNISFLFIKAIGQAKKRVFVQSPYFLPTEGILRALQTSALAGVDVRIMLPLRSDSAMLDSATHSYITECLQSGIKVYLYTAGMLHAKTLLVDDEFSSVGSTNLDFRSFEHNFEGNMQIYSKEFNKKMADIFLADQNQCKRVTQAEWKKRPIAKKTMESIIRLFSPVL